jgi:inosine/xanthosine triphosphate pyrophosphatase family protein/dephospho-CoA kinase
MHSERPRRPRVREALRNGEKRLEVYFYTSNIEKFLHASEVFRQSGIVLQHFRSHTEPYSEDYSVGKRQLLTDALSAVRAQVGKGALLFVEDTSLRIESLSSDSDVPGLAVKEWFSQTSFAELDEQLQTAGGNRSATVKSDIALHVPGLERPVFFSGQCVGRVADSPPEFERNAVHPWLTPNTFNGWFIPDGANKRLGEMTLEESWVFDFRTDALEKLLDRLEEYGALLNLPSTAYSRPLRRVDDTQPTLFELNVPVIIVVGKTCAGKSTFGERAQSQHKLEWVEASSVLRGLRSEYDQSDCDGVTLATRVLGEKGPDAVARRVIDLFSDEFETGLVITGFRTIEELETIKRHCPTAEVVLIDSSERMRFARHLARGRLDKIQTLAEFQQHDQSQWRFGLLRVAEECADRKIMNDGTIEEYRRLVDKLIEGIDGTEVSGLRGPLRPRHGLEHNQLFRCLAVLEDVGQALSCDEIEHATGRNGGIAIRHNNANKVLKHAAELSHRYEMEGQRVRYQISDEGRAFLRYMRSQFTK